MDSSSGMSCAPCPRCAAPNIVNRYHCWRCGSSLILVNDRPTRADAITKVEIQQALDQAQLMDFGQAKQEIQRANKRLNRREELARKQQAQQEFWSHFWGRFLRLWVLVPISYDLYQMDADDTLLIVRKGTRAMAQTRVPGLYLATLRARGPQQALLRWLKTLNTPRGVEIVMQQQLEGVWRAQVVTPNANQFLPET